MVCTPWAAVLGSRTRVDPYNRSITKPLTGEPDAGDPPVRFGGRGKVQSLVPTPIFAPLQAQTQSFEVGDGLLKDVAEDIYINHRADFGVLVRVGHFARGPVIVIAEVLEIGADLIGYLEGVQTLIQGEEAAVVGGDVQAGIAFVNGAEEAPEVEPDGPGIVRVAVLEGVLEGFGGQQAAVLAKRTEQNTVQQLLNAAEDFLRGDGGVLAAQPTEHPLADVGVERIELVGKFAPDGFGGAEQLVEVAIAVLRDDAFGPEEEDEAF